MKDRVCVGAIAGAFGVKGEVRLKSFCAEPADIARYAPLSSEDGKSNWDVTISRPVKNGFAARTYTDVNVGTNGISDMRIELTAGEAILALTVQVGSNEIAAMMGVSLPVAVAS